MTTGVATKPRTITLPMGVKYEFTLPPYSHLPNLDQAAKDVGDLIVAAFSTSLFPEAKEKQINLINHALAFWNYRPPMRQPNRAERRRKRRK